MARPKGTTRKQTRLSIRQSTCKVLRPTTTPKPVTPPQPTRVLRSQTKATASSDSSSTPITARTRRRRRAGADPWFPRRKPKDPNPRPRQPPPTHFTCRICAEEKPVDTFIRWISTYRPIRQKVQKSEVPFPCVAHLARNPRRKNDPVCKACIGQSMTSKLDMLGARKVSTGCLEPGCTTYWDFDSIMRYFPTGEPLEKYNNGMLNVWLEDSKTVTCVKEGCDGIGIPDPMAAGYPQVSCHICETRMCAICLIPWHTNLTCAEHAAKHINDKMTDLEKATLKIMQKKDGKRCPNCYMVIEKDGGCDSMYCMGCRTYFNWATAASAVLGKNKAIPVQHGQPYWNPNPGPVVCEMDALAKVEGSNGESTGTKARAEVRAGSGEEEWRGEAAAQDVDDPIVRRFAATNATALRALVERD